MKLRPHHLLCTQAYEGMGYSQDFVNNMNEKIILLRGEKDCEIDLVRGLDNLCGCCPHNKGTVCESEENVNFIDEKVCTTFGLKEGKYIYQDLVKKIKREITEDAMRRICGTCSWYKSGRCLELIVKNK